MIERNETAATQPANAAEAFVGVLHANGIDTIFGLPGSTEAPLLEALRKDGTMRYVLTLQESVTVAMADGYARASGRVGLVGLHTSVGTMNGLSQIYNAYRDGVPVVVTAGHKDSGVLSADGFCAIADLPGLARTFTKLATQSLTSGAVAGDLRRAINVAAAPPAGPTYLAIPEDVQAGAAPPADDAPAFAVTSARSLARRPDAAGVAAAVDLLLRARRPILVLGAPASESRNAARALAEALELPVFAVDRTQLTTLPYPVRDARYLGQYGEEKSLIEDADCVLAIGGRVFFPFSSDSAPSLPAGAQLIHAHAEAQQVGWTTAPAVGLSGDAGAVLDDLRAAVAVRGGLPAEVRAERIGRLTALRDRYERAQQRDRARSEEAAAQTGLIPLIRLVDELAKVLPDDALIFDEAVSSSRPILRHTPFADATRVYKATGGALGWGLPAAVGAKIAQPNRTVIALVGDGSFHFTPQALWTAKRENAPVVVIVVDNSGYLAVKRAIERHLHVGEDPRLHPGTAIAEVDHVSVARGYGADAERIDDPARLGPALAAAMCSERSTVLVLPVPNAR
jgi:benzoylformate decarboxylase